MPASGANFTVLGEAAGQLSEDVKTRFSEVTWQQPVRLRSRIVHGYWSVDMKSWTLPPESSWPHLRPTCGAFSPASIRMPDQGPPGAAA